MGNTEQLKFYLVRDFKLKCSPLLLLFQVPLLLPSFVLNRYLIRCHFNFHVICLLHILSNFLSGDTEDHH